MNIRNEIFGLVKSLGLRSGSVIPIQKFKNLKFESGFNEQDVNKEIEQLCDEGIFEDWGVKFSLTDKGEKTIYK